MRIGVIGGGNVGGGLARLWEQAGHDVRVSARDTVTETAAFGDVVVLAVSDAVIEDVLGQIDATGRVLVDASNPTRGGKGNADVVRLAPGARVVKAFNTNFAALYDRLPDGDPRPSMVFCGDDAEAKDAVASLIRDAGFEPIDVGGLDQAANVEGFALMEINLAYRVGRGRFFYRFEWPS
jgi:predicted dinucleotide-binding enzyme